MSAVNHHRRTASKARQRIARGVGALIGLLVTAIGMNAFAYDLDVMDVNRLSTEKSRWVILDARPRSAWREAHLPDAWSFSWEDYTRTDAQKIPYRICPPDELAAALEAMGIGEQTRVVVYGDADTSWGGEGWVCWALIWLGHQGPVRLLGGGVQAWQRAGLAMTDTDTLPGPTRSAYPVRLRDEVFIDANTVASLDGNGVLVDTRSTLEWLTGHLPQAIHLPWTSLYQGQDRYPIDAAAYGRLLNERGIKTTDEPIFYCTGGIRSAYAWVIHQLCGKSKAKNFEGGTEAWDRLKAR